MGSSVGLICGLALVCAIFQQASTEKLPLLFKSERQAQKSDVQPPFQLVMDKNGGYSLQQGTRTWFSTEDSSLRLVETEPESGIDKIGRWNSTCFRYSAGDVSFRTCVKTWANELISLPAVLFQQEFINGTRNSAQDPDSVISGFPSFQVPDRDEGLGYQSYQGGMFGSDGKSSRWYKGHVDLSGGIEGGPLALFDQQGSVVIIAPWSQFMASSRAQDKKNRVSWGVMGGVDSVPPGFQYQTVVFFGYTGINQVFSQWGEMMRYYYDKDDIYRKTDVTLNYLGYWTDGGAYYFYQTEPNKTYEQTILDVYNYSLSLNLPYRYVQYDSWFYPKGPKGGVTTWSPGPDIAPDGFQYIFNKTLWPAGAHNRWWSSQTPYAKQNGGRFNFIVEDGGSSYTSRSGQCGFTEAFPDFWLYLFKEARTWGLIMYEQDHLNEQFAKMKATLSTVDVARTWLLQMGEAARATGLTIQYCMSNPRHAMQSLEIPVVTQARVSGDYRGGSDQWQIGKVSVFADAIGIAPFKDNFWSEELQPDNHYNLTEPHSELQAAVATLSTGPVAPADMIGHTNASMLMQCCNAGGLVLRPNKPATAIDKQFMEDAFHTGVGPRGQVWTTFSQIGETAVFGIILAAAMDNSYSLTPTDAGFQLFIPTVAIPRSAYGQPPEVLPFTDDSPLRLTEHCGRNPFCMYYTSPVYQIGNSKLVIYGEENKFVPMSRDRVSNIDVLTNNVALTLKGVPGETTVFLYFLDGRITRVSCVFGMSGSSVLSVKDSSKPENLWLGGVFSSQDKRECNSWVKWRVGVGGQVKGQAAIDKNAVYFKSEDSRNTVKRNPSQANPFQFSLDKNGNYTLRQGQTTWLQGAPTFLETDGQKFTGQNGSLKLTGTSEKSGTDKIGEWSATCFLYKAGNRGFQCCVKRWINPSLPAVIFQQIFVDGASNAGGSVSVDRVLSGFPSFQVPISDAGLAYVSYQGLMFGGTDIRVARWCVAEVFLSGGLEGGPLALFDQNGGAVIVAPFSEFMSASRSQDEDSRVNWGVMGGVEVVPKQFQYDTIVFYGDQGINQLMRFYYDKADDYRDSDMTLNYLGYWTDGGAYYYYNTEPHKNYEQTILDVKNYTDSVNIPYRYVQYDSWFYPKGPHDGVLTWTPTAEVAPDGFQSSQTPYAKDNGGPYNFIVEKEKAIPQDLNFWLYLFTEARTWGLILYEQDWLNREFADMNATLSTVDVARTWLLQMGEAARATGLTIQYCMSNPRHAMQSLEIPVVTQARVSDDYRAGSDQWQIGEASIFANAMGIAPFKDTFWTIKVQPGNTYKREEPNGELQAMVSTLSMGPVGPSDMIGHTNVSMLMQCCRADGLVLRPSKPATAIDKQFWQKAWGGNIGPDGEVWTTYSQIGDRWTFGIILAADLRNTFNITPTDAGFQSFNPTVTYTRSAYSVTPMLYPFSEDQPIFLTNWNCNRNPFCVYYTGPVFRIGNDNIVLYGEEYKFVPMSRGRVANLDVQSDVIMMTLLGMPGEVPIISYFINGEIVRTTCTIGTSGKSVLSIFGLPNSCKPLG
ncbi:hypothetical protein BaRGS_00036000 [Batillaria attramentaria]|uniref:Uncharacterized protein n=1 Tax=Batillaria attramentaria TaxID=370345 RepID=A0ABD0JD40_9CAEN